MSVETQTDAFANEFLTLALIAHPASTMRSSLCHAACYDSRAAAPVPSESGIERKQISDLLRRVNDTHENEQPLSRKLRVMRNVLEGILDDFDNEARQ